MGTAAQGFSENSDITTRYLSVVWFFSDLGMWITEPLQWGDTLLGYAARWVQLAVAGAILGVGVIWEVRSDILLIPGEGLPITISRVFHIDFGKVKIAFDVFGSCGCHFAVTWHLVVGDGILSVQGRFFHVLCWNGRQVCFAAHELVEPLANRWQTVRSTGHFFRG